MQSILIAGGIGITPIRSMFRRLRALGRTVELYYACRSRQDAAFLQELERQTNVSLYFDDESGGTPMPIARIVQDAPADAHLYCCGPAPMLSAFESAATAGGRHPNLVHVEYFTQKHPPTVSGGFVVQLARSGREIPVPPGVSILNALRAAGIEVPSSCEEGVCGTCETRVLAGRPDHRDSILTDAERQRGDTMMICCSGSQDPKLVLDL